MKRKPKTLATDRTFESKDGGQFELANCMNTILGEIADSRIKRRSVAMTYAFCLRQKTEEIDWGEINRAIINRWSVSALEWIKKQAWSGKCFA